MKTPTEVKSSLAMIPKKSPWKSPRSPRRRRFDAKKQKNNDQADKKEDDKEEEKDDEENESAEKKALMQVEIGLQKVGFEIIFVEPFCILANVSPGSGFRFAWGVSEIMI